MRLVLALLLISQTAHPGVPFQPWGRDGYATVNAIEFSPDGQSMFVALFPAQIAKLEGRAPSADAPEVSTSPSIATASGRHQ